MWEVCSRDPLLLGLPLKGQEEEELVARAQCGWFLVLIDSLELCISFPVTHLILIVYMSGKAPA